MILDKFKLSYKPYGRKALLMEWPRMINESVLQDILRFKQLITEAYPDLEQIPAYNSLCLVALTPLNFDSLISSLKTIYAEKFTVQIPIKKVWHIPVCYDLDFGIDMDAFSLEKKMSIAHIIELHTAPEYMVYCIGFLPGFMYLGGLNSALVQPRRSEPRLSIPKGSVGIGGQQTGIYPQKSPGGWNIIGNSPVPLFDPNREDPCVISVGDGVKFYPIDKAEHQLMSIQVEAKIYQFKSYQTDDSST